ncbi:DUF5677 domain-containing protein [Paenibacillus sp. MER 99-2]|uniref:DUF5677 domain-containing protein n=1 Tax=Paenibacillus sp. MER 99-2 TaxID=2939572 RepID=UPI00203B2EE9|nr:DUF5677 domain-containing protein [Paenibacillus sp. MER 99-2]MCM3175658.1 DUF5677 domain-containing protein [Paenibacillus sp. MER 99-2]
MEIFWSNYVSVGEKYNLESSEGFKSKIKEKLWDSAYQQHPNLVVWGDGKNELLRNSLSNKKYNFDVFLFVVLTLGNYPEQLNYARQVTAHRIIDSIQSFLILIESKNYSASGATLRLILESISMLEKVLRKAKFSMSKIEKYLKQVESSQDEAKKILSKVNEEFIEIEKDLNKLVSETFVDWPEYSKTGRLQEYKLKEDYFDPTPQMGYSKTISKMETTSKPHKGETWSMLYTFLCDFTHPSVGSRINGLDTEKSKIYKIGNVNMRKLVFSNISKPNKMVDDISTDLMYFSFDLLNLYVDVHESFEEIHKQIKRDSRKLLRITLKHIQKSNNSVIKQLKSTVKPYDPCICFGEQKFKFCCGNTENW